MTRKTYTESDYEPFIGKSNGDNRGLAPLPNAEDADPLDFLNTLASGGNMMLPKWGYALLPDGSRQQWTQFFLLSNSNMGMELGGEGYAVTYGGQRWAKGENGYPIGFPQPIVRRFAICKHEIESHAGANPLRGWHPGHCKHCGMDMTIDSGD